MIAERTASRITRLGLIAVMATADSALADYPNYPPRPTVVEYAVDPNWPKRPAELGPSAAVPGIAVDRDDRVWCLSRGLVPVQVFSPQGELVKSWGKGLLTSPHSIRFDGQGNVWISDPDAQVVQKFTPEGRLLLTLGTPSKSGEDASHLNRPTDMAVTPAGEVFVSDGYGNRRVVHFDAHGKFVKAWGEYGGGPGQFCLPHQIVVDSQGTLYVADRNSGRILLFDQQGKFLDQWSNVVMPWGMAITAKDELWVCGSSPQNCFVNGKYPPPKDQVFMRFSTDGMVRQIWTVPLGVEGRERPGECNWLHAVALDSHGNIYAGDIFGKGTQKFIRVADTLPK